MATRTVEVIITGNSRSAEDAFLRLDAAAAASGISLERHSVASVAASGKTKELGTVAEQTAGALQKDLRGGVDDIANALGGHLGPASGTATTAVKSLGNEILGASGVMKVAAGAAIVGGVAVLGLGAYALESVGKWAALGESVLKFQRLSGTTAEEASRLIYVMGELGISSDTASAAMFKMTRADPGKLHDLGVEIKYNADGSQNLAGTLDNVRAAYQATQDPVQRSLILFTAFGKAGQALGPYLAMSTEQLRIFNEEAIKHHAIFTQDELDQAHNYTLATRNMSAAMEGLGLELAKTVIPALTSLVQSTTSGVESVDRWTTKVEEATKHTGFWNDLLTGMQPKQATFVAQADAGGKSMSVWSSIVKEVLHPQQEWHAAVQDSGNAAEKAGKQTAAASEASKAQADQLKVDTAVMAANTGGIYTMNDADVQHVIELGKVANASADVIAAGKLMTDQDNALVKAVQAFIDPLAVYTAATTKQAAADQAAAQAAGLSKDQQKYSQDDWISHTHVTTAQYLDDLTKQVNDQTTWEANMVELSRRASAGTLQYLAELGPKGAPLVAQLVNASDAEMDRMNKLMDAKSQTATQAVVDRIKQAKPVWEAVMTEGGQGAVTALAAQLNAGTVTVADIAAAYGQKLAGGINPILVSLGKAEIRGAAAGWGWSTPGLALGGMVHGEGGPRDDRVPILASDGEFVVNAKATENNRAALEWMNAAKFADGGYVDGSSVPRPPSTNPFRLPISTAADDVMQREYDEAVKWVNENAGGGKPEIKAWINAQSGKPYIWGGGGPGGYDCCTVGSVRVYGSYGAKPIKDVQVGDEVYSYVDGKLATNRVTAAWQSKTQPVFKVRTRNRSVTASANHPFMRLVCVKRGYHVKGGRKGEQVKDRYDVEWVRLDQLRPRDLVVQPRAMPVEAPLDPTLPGGVVVTPDVAWLIGASIGDGTVTRQGLRLALYGEKRERAVEIMTLTWGGRPLRHATAGIIHSNVALRDAFEALGMRCLGPVKRVPEVVWTWPADLRQAFLDGYCDADGHRPANPKRHGDRVYHSSSRELIEDVRALHIMLGQPISNVAETKRTKPITIKGKLVKNALTLHSFTVWPGKGRTGEVNDRHNHPGIAVWLDRNVEFTINPVLAITDEGTQDTYDLTVEGAHNFIADGVVVHNSGYTGAVYGLMTGRGGGQGQRYFTTLSDFHALGFSDGPGGTYTIGVSPSHMVGRYGGLPFEAGHTPIVAGPGAQNTAHFPRQYHMGGNGPGQGVGAGSGGMWLGDSGTPAGGAKGYAQSVLNARGWGDQFGALDFIFTNESGWDPGPGSINPSSGAYGIPQANPSGGQGHPYALGDWKAQVDWGINYIAQRYGDPNGAAAFWRSHSWYDQGGILPPGTTLATNATGQNEYVLNQSQMANLAATVTRDRTKDRQPTVVKQFNMGGVVVRDTAGAVMDEFHRLELLAGV